MLYKTQKYKSRCVAASLRRFMVQNAGILMRIAHLEKHQIVTLDSFR